MTGPAATPEPAAAPAEADAEVQAEADAEADGDTPAPPANRAERRARKTGKLPTHAGPQSAGHTRGGKGPRSHTKRV